MAYKNRPGDGTPLELTSTALSSLSFQKKSQPIPAKGNGLMPDIKVGNTVRLNRQGDR